MSSNHAVTVFFFSVFFFFFFFFFKSSTSLHGDIFLGWSLTSIFLFFRCARLLHILPVLCVKWHAKLQMGYMECTVTIVIKMSILLIFI